ncbi:hypothetical protein BTJ14_05550 [Lactobacillus delbrueckii subsp. bulgaricus]|nr:hypothetical protein [Lactobacillus delbrueckii subsp. bulgaricus]
MPGHAGTGGRDVIFAWEQCKAKELFESKSKKDHSDLPVLSATQENGIVFRNDLDIDIKFDTHALSNYKVVSPGDYIISLRSFQGGFELSEKLGIISPAYTVFAFNNQEEKRHNNTFWKYLFKRYDFIESLKRLTFGIRDGKAISFTQFSTLKLSFPNFDEQNKIATLLHELDRTITLHEEKKHQLERLKSALLQKMFADENGYPAVRFRGFDEAWKQCKLGDVGQTYTGLSGKSKEDFGHGKARFVTYMNIYSNPVSDLNMVEPIEIDERQNEVQYGDAFFTTSSETPEEVGMASVWTGDEKHTYLNSFCFGYRPISKINPYYLAYMLNSQSLRRKIVILAQGISRYNISKKSVMEIPASLPSAEEQNRIGLIFKDLDQSITLYEHKLELLKRLKSSLLQNMFI